MRLLETLNCSNDLAPVCWGHQAVRTAWSSVLWHSFEFSVKWHAWETSYAIRWKKFTCSSGHLTQCFQDLFDFICTSLSALNSYFALFKTTRIPKCRSWSGFFSDVADYELFSVHNPLSNERSKLKVSYVNKTFQKKPEHFCSRLFTLEKKYFFANYLFYVKKTRRINEARVIRALLI